jgi:hypothetical protein
VGDQYYGYIGPVYSSTNSGVTWTQEDAPAENWTAVTSSADGSKLVAIASEGHIAILQSPAPPQTRPPSPQLNLTSSVDNLRLSWLVPSARFALQQSSSLVATNWADVQIPAILNLKTLHYEVTVPPSKGHAFYRLRQQ